MNRLIIDNTFLTKTVYSSERCEKVYRWFIHIASDFEKHIDNNVQFAKLDLDMFDTDVEVDFFRELFGYDVS